MRSKRCTVCKTAFPLDRNHFYEDKSKTLGFTSACKICRKEQVKKLYHKSRTQNELATEDRLLVSNQNAINALVVIFRGSGRAMASLQLEDASEPILDGIEFFKSSSGGKVRFTTPLGVETRNLSFVSVETLAHTLANYQLRILHDSRN